jgi:hypothetical protein
MIFSFVFENAKRKWRAGEQKDLESLSRHDEFA